MKPKIILSLIIAGILTLPVFPQVPFHRGVNLTNWFQASSAHQIQFGKFTEQDIINIKSLGCDVIRLPINLHFMTNGEPDYTIDPLFFSFLDTVVNWAEKHQIHLLIDNHTFDPAEDTDPLVGDILVKVWTQMAQHYRDRSSYIYYEILNEPHGISDQLWAPIQQTVINAIRAVDSIHTLIVGPAGWNSYNNLEYLPEYSDTNLIYTFHFYDPFLFTHQGATWVDPSMAPLAGVPFPYDEWQMPTLPESLKGSWVESIYNTYPSDGTVAKVKSLIDIAINFRDTRNVPIFCGELGVYIPNSNNDDRINWYYEVIKYLNEKEIPWTTWDYKGGFGLFKKGSNDLFEYDLNIPLVDTIGFNAPDQKEFTLLPDTTGFTIYGDHIMKNLQEASWISDGQIDFYNQEAKNGLYSIFWEGAGLYNYIGLRFRPIKDMSWLVQYNYALNLWVRGNATGASIDVRFIDTKTDEPDDHPWRMRKIIDESLVNWNGDWHHLFLPLKSFTEEGAWDVDTWYNSIGAFDWSLIDRFEIVSEHHALTGMEFWFDDIEVSDIETANRPRRILATNTLTLDIYPNPTYAYTTIMYHLPFPAYADLSIYNLSGQKIKTLVNSLQPSGYYSITWDCTGNYRCRVLNGIYICRLLAGEEVSIERVVIMRI